MKNIVFVPAILLLIVNSLFTQEEFLPGELNRAKREITYKLPFFSRSQNLTVEVVNGYGIFQGDIILFQDGIQKDAGIEDIDYRWNRGEIPYEIANGHPQRVNILEAVQQINEVGITCVKPRNGEADYVMFVDGPGYASWVGRQGGPQDIIIGGNAVGSIQHEILHAAGMYHEQSRSDRDNFVIINWDNIIQGKEGNFELVEHTLSVCPYDFGSIMHYSATAFTKNGQATITPINPLPEGVVMGQRSALSECDIDGLSNLYPNASGCDIKYWKISYGAIKKWEKKARSNIKLSNLRFGDFDGDNKTDVFSVANGQWRYSKAGAGKWINLEYSKIPLDQLRFGDFDGDGKTDVFSISNGQWRYSKAGAGKWIDLETSNIPLDQLRFGDFDADGKTDVFSISKGQWRYSKGGAGKWIDLEYSKIPIDQLRFGDFNGDGKTDVFSISNGQWRYSNGGAGKWIDLENSNVPLDQLRFGDFDGDGRTDVFSVSNGQWRYSKGGSGKWINLGNSKVPLEKLSFGDFNGDKITDVFVTEADMN